MHSDRDEVLTQARRTPLSRPAVTELAKSIGAARLKEHAPVALDAAGLHVATVMAFALIAAGETLEPAFTAKLLAEIDADEHVGPIARAAGTEGAVKALTLVLDDADATSHRKALALLVLSDILGEKEEAPEEAVTHARQLARYALEADSSVLLGGAAARLGDDDFATLSAPYIKAAKKQRKMVDDALEISRRPALEALAETASRGIAVGFTVRREAPAPGRNDACPCGSGKKWKKCCAQKNESPTFEPGRIDEVTLAEEQAEALRGSELVQLDLSRVPKRAFIAAFRRAVAIRRWDLVDKFIADALKRNEKRELDAKIIEDMHYVALEAAILARAPDVAQKHLEKLPEKYTEAVALDMAFLRDEPRVLSLLEEAAIDALDHESDGARAIELAHAILPYQPALGILVARGALHEGRVKECQRLLEKMEDARDRILVAPVEPWWDFYEAMIEEADDQREERARAKGEKELRAELKRARQAARKASGEIAKLQERQKEIEDTLSAKPLPKKEKKETRAPISVPERPAELEEEKKRLKQKIDELQRIIGEGQEERRELRRKLQDVVEDARPSGDDEDEDEEEEDESEEPDEPGDGVDAPRNVLVPRFSDRASKAMADLTNAAADGVLTTVAGLAAGRENAWSYVKRLTKVRGVFSARAGIHHRVLFATGDRTLDVLEVIHRKDLEQAVERLTVSR